MTPLPTDRLAAVTGVVFTVFGLLFLADAVSLFDVNVGAGWVVPILLIAFGVAGLISTTAE